MLNLNRLQMFVAIVETGSFTKAAASLDVTKAMLSFNLKRLEGELGVSLLTRTTRRIALTDAGQRFFDSCVQVLSQAEAAIDAARSSHAALTGTLRVTSTAEYGAHMVVPALAAFAQRHEGLKVDFSASPGLADLVSDRFDLALRLGSLRDSTYRAALMERFATVPVASAAYLERHQAPATPQELQALDGIFHTRFEGPLSWTHTASGEIVATTHPRQRIVTDNAAGMRSFALAGAGVAILPEWLVQEDLAAGRLLRLLPGYALPEQGVYAVYPNTRHLPAKVGMFIAFLRDFIAHSRS
ncbi:LysR family transcriptional regulator [Massilia violaceinigra]|uniref:LysR family transcriptional regulator n=1 Tax=Massilia violaceinigra TaxID=2045208 RepID=A0A2D2DE83_9BURK|nr:LysR family transcriptional regulator [Massilia violaceinigra]ATQ73300.1 LysR family transcriptional regulator [Massilia violaceinigra]